MAAIRTDPLLAVAKAVTWLFVIVFGIAIAALAIAAPVLIFARSAIAEGLATESDIVLEPGFFAACALLMVAVGALIALAIWFFRLLQKIIDSVGEGDPFVPANATRLSHMAWLTVAGWLVSFLVAGLAIWVGSLAGDAADRFTVDIGFDADVSSLLLALVLFILARVFKRGAEMRADLQGTV